MCQDFFFFLLNFGNFSQQVVLLNFLLRKDQLTLNSPFAFLICYVVAVRMSAEHMFAGEQGSDIQLLLPFISGHDRYKNSMEIVLAVGNNKENCSSSLVGLLMNFL